MSLKLGPNIAALSAQRQLERHSAGFERSITRLSSGMRINSAADDAAGLAIAGELNVKGRVYSQSIRNINDGISAIRIAEGAVSELTNIVTRQKELAEQAANGTYTTRQRRALQSESDALTSEYNRIIQSTSFNGVSLLSGTNNGIRIQQGFGTESSTMLALGNELGVSAGDGTFRAPVNIDGIGITTRDVVSGDFNGDGKLDFAITRATVAPGVAIALGNGDGTFKIGDYYATAGSSFIEAGDFDHDGILDLVTSELGTDTITMHFGRGDGGFTAQRSNYFSQDTYAGHVQVADFDDDGFDDIAVSTDTGIQIFKGRSDRSFTHEVLNPGEALRGTQVGDLNNDGFQDIVAQSVAGPTYIYLNRGDGTFGAAFSQNGFNTWSSLGDINGDGNLDIAGVHVGSGFWQMAFGNGDGTFGSSTYGNYGTLLNSVYLVDLNNDDKADRIDVSQIPSAYTVSLSNGDGTFLAPLANIQNGYAFEASFGDFNGDGVMDMMGANEFAISVFLGNSDASGRRDNLIDKLELRTVKGARTAIGSTTVRLEQLNKELGQLGSSESRLSTSLRNLSSTVVNYEAARNRIVDTDVASESANLLKTQILKQAATAVLGQANTAPQLALKLLTG